MKKRVRFFLPLLLTILFINHAKAQIAIGTGRDSLKKYQQLYNKSREDKYLFWIYISKGYIYRRNNTDSEYYYGSRALKLAKKTKSKSEETLALDVLQYCQRAEGNFAEALNLQFRMLELSKELKLAGLEGQALNSIGNTYLDMDAPQIGLNYYRKSLAVFDRQKVSYMQMNERSNIGNAFEKLNMLDSALFYEQNLLKNKQFPADLLPELIYRIGNANVKLGKYRDAISYYKKGLADAAKIKTINDVATIYYQLAKLNFNMHMPDSANYYALRALNVAKSISLSDIILKSSQLLVNIFESRGKTDSAYYYQKIATHYNDILFGAEKFNRIQQILSAEQRRQQELLQQQEELKNRYRIIGAAAILVFVLIILLLVWRNSLQRKKAFALLQKQNLEIEGQKREATIEAALERIRATSMAMQQSSELLNVIKTITTQLGGLGVDFEGSDFVKVNDDKSWDMWICTKEEMQPFLSHIPYFEHREFLDYEEAKKNHVEFYSYSLTPEESLAWMDHFFNRSSPKTPFPVFSDERMQRLSQSSSQSASVFVHREILLAIFRLSDQPFTDEENSVFKRIGKVFEQAYTRFLDLKKAEAQARESQIELALERVRARTMAMQRSEELSETAAVLFQQFRNLGTELIQVTIGVFNETEHVLELRVTDFRGGGAPMSQSRNASLDEPTLISKAYRAWKEKQKSLIVDLQGDELRAWIAYRNQMVGETDNTPFADRRVLSYAFFSKGEISISSAEPLPAETMRLLERFAAVFDGTYTRFLDLKKAEAQAREAQIEAALERVRSRTMAMRSSDELAETAEVLFKQLITLGIAPNRLFIGIIAEDNGEIELWATNEDGSKLAARFTGNKAGNTSVAEMYGGWKRREGSITIVMEGKVLDDYFKYLKDELKVPFPLGLTQKRRIQSIAYFSKGFIGMASPEEQPKETISLLERFAGVFNLTFVRFHDLKIAEAHAKQAELDLVLLQTEKKRTEEAFIELKATQAQLIQSEKMASLGELTAGIAHEIQNPLNFVNNFSEVNQELLAEMKEEIEKGNYEEVKAIVGDIEENEIKINHHGKRADSIVKGMLQHSRAGSHIKAPTNINALADEYLRLSYHGLRAKDKTFNAELITHFVDGLPLVKMVPLDIGRVLLNLFNNAFYAVKERQKTASVGYKPEVTVSTEWEKDHIVIRVKDNGNGIPDAIKDKIMQPFFTTKPTGEGTGLGLSLSYDIVVKGHGGSIQVDSDEGEGSEFVISLPIK